MTLGGRFRRGVFHQSNRFETGRKSLELTALTRFAGLLSEKRSVDYKSLSE
jgi:hypothetical protein